MIKYLKSKWTAFIVGLFIVVFGANTALAASLSQVTVAPDSGQAGVMTNHLVSFQTSSTGAISGAGVIEVTYPASFDLSQTSLGFYDGVFGSAWFSRSGNTIYINMGSAASLGNSEATFFQIQNVVNTSTAGSYNISVTTKNAAGMIVDGPIDSVNFAISQVQTLDHFAVSPSTTNTTVGQNVTLTIAAQDASNNTVTGYAGTPTLSGLATAPNSTAPYYGPVNFSNGVANVTVRSYSAQSGQSVTVTDAGKIGNSGLITFGPGVLASIQIEPSQSIQTITAGTNIQFTATGSDVYGNARTGDQFSWTGTNSTGQFDNRIAGNYTVYASYAGINSNQVSVGVTHGQAVIITVSPDPTTIVAGSIITYTATATDAYTNTWDVTNTTTFSITAGAGGSWSNNVYTSANTGTWIVTGANGSLNDTAYLSVTNQIPVLTTIRITPNTNQIIIAGTPLQFSAMGYDQFNNPISGIVFTWSGTNSSGLFTNTTAGIYTVRASSGSINSDPVTVIVNPAAIDHIHIEPSISIQSITAGGIIEFHAYGFDTYNNPLTGYSYTWHNTTQTGLFNKTLVGSYQVYASYQTLDSNYVTVNVGPANASSVMIFPFWNESIGTGTTTEIIAIVIDAYGNAVADGSIVNWSVGNSNFTLSAQSSNTLYGIAKVNLIAPNICGQSTTVSASINGITSISGTLTTQTQILSDWEISDPGQIIAGESFMLIVTPLDQFGEPITNYDWSNPAMWPTLAGLGTINGNYPNYEFVFADHGIAGYKVTPRKAETGTSVAVILGAIMADSPRFNVIPASLNSIIISPLNEITITTGDTINFTATGYDQYGNRRIGDQFSWTGTENSFSGLFNNSTLGKYQVFAKSSEIVSNSTWVTVDAKAENTKQDSFPSDDNDKKTPSYFGVQTAKAQENTSKAVVNDNNQTGQAVEIATQTTPLIEASSTEKPTRNWWIPIIIIVIIAGAACYGYTAMTEKNEKSVDNTKKQQPEKQIVEKKNINTSETKEIKPINDDKDEKPRW